MADSLLKKMVNKAITNAKEKDNSALLKPPKNVTNVPTKNTAVAVKNLPKLKQNPEAVALIKVGNK